jgi:hypothetical protein
VQHDAEGLAQLLGGRAALASKLDKLFDQRPVFHLGDAVVVKELAHPQVGDVIVFSIPAGEPAAGMLVVHRIHGVRADGTFETKGDNRRYPDTFRIRRADILGSPAWTLPHFGRLVGLARRLQRREHGRRQHDHARNGDGGAADGQLARSSRKRWGCHSQQRGIIRNALEHGSLRRKLIDRGMPCVGLLNAQNVLRALTAPPARGPDSETQSSRSFPPQTFFSVIHHVNQRHQLHAHAFVRHSISI